MKRKFLESFIKEEYDIPRLFNTLERKNLLF